MDSVYLKKNTVKITHRYSGQSGIWGWWIVSDRTVLDFLGDESFIDEDLEQRIISYEKYWKLVELLKLRHTKFYGKTRN